MKMYNVIIIITMLYVLQIGAMEQSSNFDNSMMSSTIGKKIPSYLSAKNQKEVRRAFADSIPVLTKKYNAGMLSKEEKKTLKDIEFVVGRYVLYDADDLLVAEKVKNHGAFLKKTKSAGKSQQQAIQNEPMQRECCICYEENGLCEIPCSSLIGHNNERICQGCLDDLFAQGQSCPICRSNLRKEEKEGVNEKL